MGSSKPQAKAKQQAQFRANLGASANTGKLFAAESHRGGDAFSEKQRQACLAKNRYDTREDAEEAIRTNTHAGRKTLRTYRCDYCDGWHLTSKPER